MKKGCPIGCNSIFVGREVVVENWSSKMTWNWGLTSPVVVLRMSGIEDTCYGDIPK